MKKLPVLISALILAFLCGCGQSPDQNERLAKIENRLRNLETRTNQPLDIEPVLDSGSFKSDPLPAQVADLSTRVQSLEFVNSLAANHWTPLDPTSRSFQFVNTGQFFLTVAITDLETYLDGYKLHLKVGNPYQVWLDGLTVSLRWKVGVFTPTSAAPYKSLDERETVRLAPGFWTPLAISIAPATAEDMRNLEISISIDSIFLSDLK